MKKSRKKFGCRPLAVQGLEERLPLASSAFLGVVQVNTNDLVVQGIGEDDADVFKLQTLDAESGFSGHVLVEISNLAVPSGRIFGAFNVDQLQATAAAQGGNFLGFRMYGLAGDDQLDASQLKNFERTELHGDGRSDLQFTVNNTDKTDKDVLTGGELSRDRYFGGTDMTVADGKNNDIVVNADVYDTLAVTNPPFPLAFNPSISGGTGDNTLIFNPDSPGVNITLNGDDFSVVTGTNNNDTINASNSNKGMTIAGLGGDDTLIGSPQNDNIEGGEGKDTITGNAGNDNLKGGGGEDDVRGGDGNDTIDGGDGKDSVYGDAGTDNVSGGLGDDFVSGGDGNDVLNGNDGNDTLQGGTGNDTLNGGNGSDFADFIDAPNGIDVDMAKNEAVSDGHGTKDTFNSIENVNGTNQPDLIRGDGNDNILRGNGGNDDLWGRAGNDTLEGGDGNDRMKGETGNDTLRGGNDVDILLGGVGDDALEGGDQADELYGEEGTDRLSGDGGADLIDGGLGMDYLEGGPNTSSELDATDTIYTNYELAQGAVEDLAVIGGPAVRDIFRVWTLELETDASKIPAWGPAQKPGGAMNQTQRLDAQFELDARSQPANVIGARLIIFSDFDGGDGVDGDTLQFFA